MKWTEVKFSKNQINWAGNILCNRIEEDKFNLNDAYKALEILDNWRSAHAFPLHIFKNRLKKISRKLDKNSLVVQRLKRAPSVVKKLKREYGGKKATMKLSQMQDLGGCRSILSNISLVKKLSEEYYHIDSNNKGYSCGIKHEFKQKKDYITFPKSDGYRGIHLIYKYKSDKSDKYSGLLIEIQIRTELQHYWATAVETVGYFTGQAIKSNEGEEDWKRFFSLMSSVLASFEKCHLVPGTPVDKKDLFKEINSLSLKLKVIEKMETWTKFLQFMERLDKEKQHKSHFYLLNLDLISGKLTITPFEKNEEERANEEYSKAERNALDKDNNIDVVLVEADTSKDLKKAYPNYFLDTKEFVNILKEYIKKGSN